MLTKPKLMTKDTLNISKRRRTTSILALNAVSTLTHISQYGLGTMLIPIALEAKHASPEIIGFTSAILWFGMLTGLLVAGKLIHLLSYRNTVLLSMAISIASFVAIPFIDWHFWFLPAAILGCGIGLRWIANETWLYRLSPSSAQGRIVGIHEALIGLATIIGPLIIVALSASSARIFWVAAAIISAALVPLFMAQTIPTIHDNLPKTTQPVLKTTFNKNILYWLSFGGLIAGLGGWIENGLLSFLPVYASDIGLHGNSIGWLFTLLGIGAFVCQFPIGWLADIKGVMWAAAMCVVVTFFTTLFAIFFGKDFLSLAIAMFILGATLSGLLTLGIIWATQHSTGSALTGQMRQLSLTYTALSAISPFVAGFIISHTSSASLFWQPLAVIFVLAMVLIKHKD